MKTINRVKNIAETWATLSVGVLVKSRLDRGEMCSMFQDNLKMMADSLLCVCLDEETQNVTDSHRSLKDTYRQMMTGGGSRYNGANRC